MRITHTPVLMGALLFVFGLTAHDAHAQSETVEVTEQAANITEKKSEITEDEAELREEAAEIEKERATIEQKKAKLAEEEAEVREKAAALAEKQAALVEKKSNVAKEEAEVGKKAAVHTSELERKLAELQAKETERGLILTLGDVVFTSDQANLKAEALENLYPMVTFLRENPERHILIEGHTDNVGPESYNLDLSQERAAAVKNFLLRNGISPERITARGYGEEYPVDMNTTKEGRQTNRRVEIVVLREGKRVEEAIR